MVATPTLTVARSGTNSSRVAEALDFQCCSSRAFEGSSPFMDGKNGSIAREGPGTFSQPCCCYCLPTSWHSDIVTGVGPNWLGPLSDIKEGPLSGFTPALLKRMSPWSLSWTDFNCKILRSVPFRVHSNDVSVWLQGDILVESSWTWS